MTMTYTDLTEEEFTFLNQHITAIEFQFAQIHPRRMGHFQQVIADNIACPGLKQAHWLFGEEDGMHTIKATIDPFHCPEEVLEELVISIEKTMDEIVPAYNQLCQTDIEHDGFKLWFLNPMPFPDFD